MGRQPQILWSCAGTLAFLLMASAGPVSGQTLHGIGLGAPPMIGNGVVLRDEEWARTLANALGLDEVLSNAPADAEVFALLCADAAEMSTDVAGRRVPARAAFQVSGDALEARPVGEPLRIVLDVPATALYQLSVVGSGKQRWSIDQRLVGHLDPSDVGVAHGSRVIPLREGPHELSGILPPSARVESVELVAYRPLCVAPAGGWQSGRPLTSGAQARTLVRALGLEPHLPVSERALDLRGKEFARAFDVDGNANEASHSNAPRFGWAKGSSENSEFVYRFRLDAPGVFSFRARITSGAEQLWSIDDRYHVRATVADVSKRFGWTHLMTTTLAAGEHVLRARVAPGSGVDRIRADRHFATDSDYLDVVEQMGFRLGGPRSYATRASGIDAIFHPAFQELADGFLSRIAHPAAAAPLVALEGSVEPLYSRPLSPVLPSEL